MSLLGRRKMRIGDILMAEGVITQEQLDQALESQKIKKRRLGEILVSDGYITDDIMADALCHQMGYDRANLQDSRIPDDLISMFDVELLKKYTAIPYCYDDRNVNIIRVAMADPMDMLAIDDLSMVTNRMIDPMVATPGEIMVAIDKYYGNAEALKAANDFESERADLFADDEIEAMNDDVNNSPIVQLVNSMIEQAVRQRTSDIHIEALEKKVRVRYRIDGALHERMTYNIKMLPAIVARLKVVGGMDIAEKRKPQDGRITSFVDGREFDIRVSILPTVYGEKVVMRLTNKNALTRDKAELGFNDHDLKLFDHILMNPHGIILVTGPTGSGKSTTLYTALSELNKEDVNIITVEDPVEANVAGINQVQTNTKAGLTFASALRSILRQDPDIIMVGETRDSETAAISVRAALTGHLVFSTLHTNDAASSAIRLKDMGLEPYLIANSMVGVVAQRLMRKGCTDCSKLEEITPEEERLLGISLSYTEKPRMIRKACGCPACNHTGYRGRVAVHEILMIDREVRRLITEGAPVEEIKEYAVRNQGMRTLKQAALHYLENGITTVEEVMKVAYYEE